jgi:hypothetical protein
LVMPTVALSPSRRTHSCWSVKRISLMAAPYLRL